MSTPIEGLIGVAMENIKGMVDVNTIVGDPVTTGDGTTIIPISRVSFGFGAGGCEFNASPETKSTKDYLFGGGTGGGATVKPVAFLVIHNDNIRVMPITNTLSTLDRVVEMVPEALSKFNDLIAGVFDKKEKKSEETIIISEE
ncbi:MAG: GerW family sporulation protein [Clostridia bacterium]|nr:GerW family sporulation protein [Clostridia bacterium]